MAAITLLQIVDYVFDHCQNVIVNGSKQDSQKQFTMTRGMVELWTNQAYKTFVVRARILKKSIEISCTAGTKDYNIPSNIVEFISCWYQAGTNKPTRLFSICDDEQIEWENYNGGGTPQRYQNQYSNSSNVRQISIYPGAVTTGDKIIIKAVLAPDDLTSDSATTFIPVTYEPALLAFVLSKAQLYCGIIGTDKQTAASLMTVFEQNYANEALDCKQRNEFFGDSHLQMQGDIDNYEVGII